jgi:class 3 adenylate cyclase/ABC-type branched-subunit amino acid transport system substrate-binding protein
MASLVRAVGVATLLAAALFVGSSVAITPTIDIGVYMSVTGTFKIFDANDGVLTWAQYVNDQFGGVKMPDGTTYRVNLIVRDDESNVTKARIVWQEFVDMGLQYVIGGHTSMTVEASTFFEPHEIVNIHCCTGPDNVYTTAPKKWILGIHRSSLDYPKGFLRQLALRGKQNIAIIYNTVSAFTITTADSAESFAQSIGMNVVTKIEYDGNGYKNLTTAPGGTQLRDAVDKVKAIIEGGTPLSLFAISLGPDGNDMASYIDQQHLDLESLFITVAPTTDAFVPAVGARAAEYVFSPLQWHNSMQFTDPIFNSSVGYQEVYTQHHGYTATYTSASGTAAGVALHLGLQSAGTIEKFAVMQALRELRADTFFGPMAFNRYQRNYGGSTPTIEILDSKLRAVLPDTAADIITVLPPTRAERDLCPIAVNHTDITACLAEIAAANESKASVVAGESADNTVLLAVIIPIVLVITIVAIALGVRAATAGANARNTAYAPKGGRVTLMFTDVQDSTKLWSTVPMCMSIALDIHHVVIRQAIDKHKCYEVKTAGDSFMVACPTEDSAVALALDIQRMLHRQAYPAAIDAVYAATTEDELLAIDDFPEATGVGTSTWNGLRVRIGFHSGEPQVQFDEVAKGYDYYGPPVNTAARVESVTKGGQVTCSSATLKYIKIDNSDFATRELGTFELKGVAEPTAVTEIMPQEFVGKRVFVNKQEDVGEEAGADDDGDTSTTATHAVDETVVESVVLTLTTMLRTMRPAEKEKTLQGIMKAWRVPWQTGARLEVHIGSLAKRLAKAARPLRALSTHSTHSSFHDAPAGHKPAKSPRPLVYAVPEKAMSPSEAPLPGQTAATQQ